jgi:hypothetical protein
VRWIYPQSSEREGSVQSLLNDSESKIGHLDDPGDRKRVGRKSGTPGDQKSKKDFFFLLMCCQLETTAGIALTAKAIAQETV